MHLKAHLPCLHFTTLVNKSRIRPFCSVVQFIYLFVCLFTYKAILHIHDQLFIDVSLIHSYAYFDDEHMNLSVQVPGSPTIVLI